MRIGEAARVRASGRDGQIVEDLGKGRHRADLYPAAGTAPTDPANVEGDETCGIFHGYAPLGQVGRARFSTVVSFVRVVSESAQRAERRRRPRGGADRSVPRLAGAEH